jgi:hypothetical protein
MSSSEMTVQPVSSCWAFGAPATADLVDDGTAADDLVAGGRPARLGDAVGVARFVEEAHQLGEGHLPAGVRADCGRVTQRWLTGHVDAGVY